MIDLLESMLTEEKKISGVKPETKVAVDAGLEKLEGEDGGKKRIPGSRNHRDNRKGRMR